MERLGTNYGGWYVPKNMELNENSIIYSGGVGEDISFDIKIQEKYKCNIFLIDPTEKALIHFNEVKEYYKNGKLFLGNIQKDYIQSIQNNKPDFSKFYYFNIGLWNCHDKLKFYKQNNKNYVSQSLIENMFSKEYDEVNVTTIKALMEEKKHKTIDLLKLDIEGAEIEVIEQMLDDKIFPKYILIEFDLFLKKKDPGNKKTNDLISRLLSLNYIILINDNYNITFYRNY
tara:strand:+ start:247 stop:933 length:687 start_codon:yes stop_codon:yes gene_type:complete